MKTINWVIRSPYLKGISGETVVNDHATEMEIIGKIHSEFLASLTVHWPYRSGDVESDGPGRSFPSSK